MAHEVLLTASARQDLEELHCYLLALGLHQEAEATLDRILAASESLEDFPERGGVPRELAALGVCDYRQLILKPYRLIYRVFGPRVVVFVIADGRRDLQTLLLNRLLGG